MKKWLFPLWLLCALLCLAACGAKPEDILSSNAPTGVTGDFTPSTEEYTPPTEPTENFENTPSGDEHVHSWTDATCQQPKKCYSCGAMQGGLADHQWQAATCTQPQLCIYCSATKGKATGHKTTAATCTKAKSCSRCGMTDGSPLGHVWGTANCTKGGQCSRCGQTGSPATGHAFTDGTCVSCGAKDPNYVAPTLVYSDAKVKIYFKEYTSSGVVFQVKNLTDITLTIQADAIAINRRSTEDITMSDDVAPRSTGDVHARCTISGVTKAALISGQLRIIDFSNLSQTYDAKFVDVVIGSGGNFSAPAISGKQLYRDNKVVIYYAGMDPSGVHFYVENNTDVVITIQADTVAINGRSTGDITMSDDVSPHSTGDVYARCSISGAGIPKTVSGTLRIVDFSHSFRTYNVTFANVSI